MRVPIDAIQYLLDVFIEGGYAEEEDLPWIDDIHIWLKSEEQKRLQAFQKRITRDVNPDYGTRTQRISMSTPSASGWSGEWNVEPHDWEGDPRKETKAFPKDYDFIDDDEDSEE